MAFSESVHEIEHEGRRIFLVGTAHVSKRSVEEVERATRALVERTPALHLWSAGLGDIHRLEEVVAACARAHGDHPPLVVLDRADALSLPAQRLADLARPGVTHPDAPGCAVLALVSPDSVPTYAACATAVARVEPLGGAGEPRRAQIAPVGDSRSERVFFRTVGWVLRDVGDARG